MEDGPLLFFVRDPLSFQWMCDYLELRDVDRLSRVSKELLYRTSELRFWRELLLDEPFWLQKKWPMAGIPIRYPCSPAAKVISSFVGVGVAAILEVDVIGALQFTTAPPPAEVFRVGRGNRVGHLIEHVVQERFCHGPNEVARKMQLMDGRLCWNILYRAVPDNPFAKDRVDHKDVLSRTLHIFFDPARGEKCRARITLVRPSKLRMDLNKLRKGLRRSYILSECVL